jgi:polar amino acid transport system permease protein
MLLVASIWYLFFTSILMVGQYFLEKRFARGIGDRRPDRKVKGKDDAPTLTGTLPESRADKPTVVLPPPEGDPPINPGHGGRR